MANTKIPSELIADSSITAAKLADGTITTADILALRQQARLDASS